MNAPRSIAVLLAVLLLVPCASVAQDQPAAQAQPQPQAQRLPPQLVLGRRVELVRQRLPTAPVVVIVPDPDTYLAQLGAWSMAARWPVLIDDGTDRAREGITRFVRAFGPERVLRAPAADPIEDRRAAAEAAIAGAWGAASHAELNAAWERIGFAPPGMVATSLDHGPWTAAVALAAARGQTIAWLGTPPAPVGGQMGRAAFSVLDLAIRGALGDEPDHAWAALGDAIETITICLDVPGRVQASDDQGPRALTDLLGRHPDGRRYAWAGWIYGDEATTAYQAMSAIFLRPTEAWVFDSYGAGFPKEFAAEPTIDLLRERGLDPTFTAPAGANLRFWRGRCQGGLTADLVHVNTLGHAQWFQLGDDRAWASEVPLLHRPAAVHFIHSFSAQYAGLTSSISERWLENGAYAYAGSVDEPFLGAFVPPSAFFARLFSGATFGAAVRLDAGPAWKIQVIGDPLIVAGAPLPTTAPAPEIDGAEDLGETVRAALLDRRFDDAVRDLLLLARDEDALRIVRSLMQDGDSTISPAIARAASPAAFRAEDAGLFADLYAALPPDAAKTDTSRSRLWQILRPELDTPRDTFVSLLRANIRRESAVADAADLAPALGKLHGPGAVRAMYQTLITREDNDQRRNALTTAARGW